MGPAGALAGRGLHADTCAHCAAPPGRLGLINTEALNTFQLTLELEAAPRRTTKPVIGLGWSGSSGACAAGGRGGVAGAQSTCARLSAGTRSGSCIVTALWRAAPGPASPSEASRRLPSCTPPPRVCLRHILAKACSTGLRESWRAGGPDLQKTGRPGSGAVGGTTSNEAANLSESSWAGGGARLCEPPWTSTATSWL